MALFFICHQLVFAADIYEEVAPSLKTLGLKPECCGGGRIRHNSNEKEIFVYGYSMVCSSYVFVSIQLTSFY